MAGVNLIPFNFNNALELNSVVRELALNLVLLMPFGFGIRFLVPFKTKQVWQVALAAGVSIEAIQLVISLMIGYPYRVIDINDVIMNTLGFLVGYGFFRLFSLLYLGMTHRLKIQPIGLGNYIYKIAQKASDRDTTGDPRVDREAVSTP